MTRHSYFSLFIGNRVGIMREFERKYFIQNRRQRVEMKKKKVVAMIMVATMAVSMNITAFAAPAQTAPVATESTVSGEHM